MNHKLYRWNSSPARMLGVAHFDDFRCHTIERPWVPDDTCKGGKPFESCVPDGIYALEPFTRPDSSEVYMLVNEMLGVYRFKDDIPEGVIGRYLILIHVGNWVKDVVGCVAPGLTQAMDGEGHPMVGSSKAAMRGIMQRLDANVENTLEIITL